MKEADMIITNGLVITQDPDGSVLRDGAIAIEGIQIIAIGSSSSITGEYHAKSTIDARGKCVFPGLINTHTHLFQTFMKGIGEDLPLYTWIRQVTTPALLKMSYRDFYLSAMIACMDAIRSGTTTIVENMYPNPYHEMGDAVLEVLVENGMRALLGRGVADIGDNDGYPSRAFYGDLTEPLDDALRDCERLSRMCKEYSDDRVRFCLALPNARCINASTFPVLSEFANDLEAIISIHILESPGDNELTNARYGQPVVQYLDGIGFLNEKILSIHSIYLSEEDIRTFSNNSVAVSYNPVSNMYLGDGVAPIVEFLKQGVRVGIGTDGAASNNSQDMLEALKAAVLLQRVSAANPEVLLGRDGFRMATIDGARTIGLDHITGSLEAGKKADIILTNFHQPKSTPFFDPINTLVFSASPSVVDTVIIDGKVILEDGRFTRIDEQSIIEEAQTAAHQLAFRTYDPEILKNCVAIQATT